MDNILVCRSEEEVLKAIKNKKFQINSIAILNVRTNGNYSVSLRTGFRVPRQLFYLE